MIEIGRKLVGRGKVIQEATPEAPARVLLEDNREIPVDYWSAHTARVYDEVEVYRNENGPVFYTLERLGRNN